MRLPVIESTQIWSSYLGSVWIELIFLKLKTENWKYCSKIIFKCVNSIAGPIFNEKIAEKWSLWVPWTVYETHWCAEKSKILATIHAQCMRAVAVLAKFCLWNAWRKKKKKKGAKHNAKRKHHISPIQTNTKRKQKRD